MIGALRVKCFTVFQCICMLCFLFCMLCFFLLLRLACCVAFQLFTNTKLWCYRITSLICGLPLSIFWGVYFACLSFCVIWCCEPYMKAYEIELSCARKLYTTFLNAFYRPCYEACGYCFYNIRITKQ